MQAIRRISRFLHMALLMGAALPLVFGTGDEPGTLHAQPLQQPDSGELQLAIARLNHLGRLLYIGAHPDDENTALLAWLARERLVDARYLSLTRGDGGQNLLGSEKGELMGVIRTHELLAARRIDGAGQLFTRAIDFGYSKSALESLEIWGHEAVLADVVWIIRRFQPDVIVARFLEADNGGHGHHSASAILAREAFHAAADPARFPEQLSLTRPWQAKRLLWNGWRLDPAQEDSLLQVDTGLYNPLLGRSYTEIAATSRSMHKSQGFGSAERRGHRIEYFRHLGGEFAPADLFDGIDLSWGRVLPGADSLSLSIQEALAAFTPAEPIRALPPLQRAWRLLEKAEASSANGRLYLQQKRNELAEVMRACSGLWLEAAASRFVAAPGESLDVSLQVINRSQAPWRLEEIILPWQAGSLTAGAGLADNELLERKVKIRIGGDAPLTRPYWLQAEASRGLYQVSEAARIGDPLSPPAATVRFRLSLAGMPLTYDLPLLHRWTDPVEGDLYRDLIIAPPVTVHLNEPLLFFPDRSPRPLHLRLTSVAGAVAGRIRPALPSGWQSTPAELHFALKARDEEQDLLFQIQPANGSVAGKAHLEIAVDPAGAWQSAHDRLTISYPHIPLQLLLPEAEARLLHVPLAGPSLRIGYIMGAGDDIPGCLQQMGHSVTLLSDDDLARGGYQKLDVIVTGVRAWNTRPVLRSARSGLLRWVEGGGTLIDQYNTPQRLVAEVFAPWPLRISRDRVSDEQAPVTLLAPEHRLLSWPSRIGPADLEGWVQERGLYFADQWDDRYTALLSSHDPGESDKKGGLLHARYGKGNYIFTGYAWFRQLPAGVPGAWRIFNNLLHAGARQ